MYEHNIFSWIYTCIYVYLYKYTQYTHIYCVKKIFILNAINRLKTILILSTKPQTIFITSFLLSAKATFLSFV